MAGCAGAAVLATLACGSRESVSDAWDPEAVASETGGVEAAGETAVQPAPSPAATQARSARTEAAAPGTDVVPSVRLLDGRASESLRRALHEAAGRRPSPAELRAEAGWIDSVAAPLVEFWASRGDEVVRRLTDVTGGSWVEANVNVHFVRQRMGVVGFSIPLVLDLSTFERVPAARSEFYQRLLLWALVHELVHRLNDQPFLALGTVGTEGGDPLAERVAGSAHDWDDLVVAFVLRDVLGEDAVRPLLFNRALQRTVGVHRLDRFHDELLPRWRPSRERPLAEWLRAESELDTGVRRPAAEAELERALTGARGMVPAPRVRAVAARLESAHGLSPEETAQLLSDWEGRYGAGRLAAFPYREPDGTWTWR